MVQFLALVWPMISDTRALKSIFTIRMLWLKWSKLWKMRTERSNVSDEVTCE